MVIVLDGNSEIGAHVGSNSCDLIWLRRALWLSTVADLKFVKKKEYLWFYITVSKGNYFPDQILKKKNKNAEPTVKVNKDIIFVHFNGGRVILLES